MLCHLGHPNAKDIFVGFGRKWSLSRQVFSSGKVKSLSHSLDFAEISVFQKSN